MRPARALRELSSFPRAIAAPLREGHNTDARGAISRAEDHVVLAFGLVNCVGKMRAWVPQMRAQKMRAEEIECQSPKQSTLRVRGTRGPCETYEPKFIASNVAHASCNATLFASQISKTGLGLSLTREEAFSRGTFVGKTRRNSLLSVTRIAPVSTLAARAGQTASTHYFR